MLQTLRLPTRSDSAAIVRDLHRRLTRAGAPLAVRLWTGEQLGGERGYRLVLRHPWSARAALLPASDRRVGEAYVRDDLDVEGSMIDALADAAAAAEALDDWSLRAQLAADLLRLPPAPGLGAPRAARPRGRLHAPNRDRDVVRFHYDLGNDFFRLFLDRRMVYSCAYFAEDDGERDDALDGAQLRKLDLVCRKLALRPDERLLDIGCGWGALVVHAATEYGVRAVGVTLSGRQAKLAREHVRRAGVADRVEIREQDYREVRGAFDAVASIGMFEHVGVDRFDDYFRACHRLTRPGGRFLNHAITTGRRGAVRDLSTDRGSFVGAYVFPDGALAPAHVAAAHMLDAGFEVRDLEELRPHYARTLRHWVRRLERRHGEAVAAAGEHAYRIWRAYMAGSVVGFESGDLGVAQILGTREPASLPLGRTWMTPRVPLPARERSGRPAAARGYRSAG